MTILMLVAAVRMMLVTNINSILQNLFKALCEVLVLLISNTVIYLTGVLISPQPDLLPDVFFLLVRIFHLMLVLLSI
jgi:hypothetical protein